ncbi:MAG: hypothetical protein KME17_23860 [Cyanosarcina radialis HA8281-LM2]|nr:hypothetical protein [Cyanosarcina radialis HA8281-LM2]
MNSSPIDPQTILNALSYYTGTENYYRHPLKQFLYTDGIKYLADTAKCYWFLDAIASYQPTLKSDPMLAEFQIWMLVVNPDLTAKLRCYRYRNDLALQQRIEFTDFPLPEIKLYLENGVLMLPSER